MTHSLYLISVPEPRTLSGVREIHAAMAHINPEANLLDAGKVYEAVENGDVAKLGGCDDLETIHEAADLILPYGWLIDPTEDELSAFLDKAHATEAGQEILAVYNPAKSAIPLMEMANGNPVLAITWAGAIGRTTDPEYWNAVADTIIEIYPTIMEALRKLKGEQ